MREIYTWLKFVHVLSVAAWLGGFAALLVLNSITPRHADRGGLSAYLRYAEGLGPRLIGPASGLALLSGLVMVLVGHVGLPLWILWGLAAAVIFILIGVTLLRPLLNQLRKAAAEDGAAPVDVASVLRKQRSWFLVNLIILALAAWAMVLKPS
ncbi:MAG TPA: DUF2269 family protein [Gemmatimonadales bacterium]|nr:DUF2269 family protein [Gemmatimonadales bacterium]